MVKIARRLTRDYDPAIGRYVQSDPIGLMGGLNAYGYAFQSPMVRTDPLGLAPSLKPFEDLMKDMGAENFGKMLGEICGKMCLQLRNPRVSPEDAASDICNQLTLDLGTRQMQVGAAMLECRKTCVEKAKVNCDKKKTSCVEGASGSF